MAYKNKMTWFSFSLTPEERDAFEAKFKLSTCRSRNAYLRCLLLSQPVTIKQRNSSIDEYIREMTCFKKELRELIQSTSPQYISALHEKLDEIFIYVEKQYRIWSHI